MTSTLKFKLTHYPIVRILYKVELETVNLLSIEEIPLAEELVFLNL